MRKVSFILAAALLMVSAAVMAQQSSKVYLTREISPESLVKIYKALGVEAKGRVAVKMSTGEGSNPNYLKPELVKNLIWEVDGTIVECNTAYGNGPAGKMEKLDMGKLWTPEFIGNQDGFLESMAAAAQAVVNYFNKKQGIIYISVMNNMSIDCDCVDHPEPVKLEDYGILASTDPVALDQACIDIINQQKVTAKNDPTDLLKRIDKQHGTHTIDHAAQIGLGSKKYELVNLDL